MTAIEFNHVSKQYRLGLVSTQTLAHDMRRFWITSVLGKEDPYLKIGETNDRTSKGHSDYVWALRDIDFKVEQGDVLGIIGKNGAGKSTLLKLLSKVTGPTTGSIRAHGRIGSLLEVGTGFHSEMTGRENIFLNGAILGMSRREIQSKLDEIIDFSGCERYIDTPVKRYSSGMMVRLGFAVAAFLEPEILVVDEVLAVGDAEFQKKAIGKMKDVSQGDGRTVLFVSHNMNSVKKLCTRGVVLKNGQVDYMGGVFDAVDYYTKAYAIEGIAPSVKITNKMRDINRSMSVRFLELAHKDAQTVYAADEAIKIIATLESDKDVEECRINCTIFTEEDVPLCNNSSTKFFSIRKGETKKIEYTLHNPGLAPGVYMMSFSVGMGNAKTGETNFDVVQQALAFEIDRPFKASKETFAKWDKSWGAIMIDSDCLVVE